jgi:hypothetical protein
MANEYIKDSTGRILATVTNTSNRSFVTQFGGKTVATYNKGTNTTVDLVKNQSVKGNQLMRFVK